MLLHNVLVVYAISLLPVFASEAVVGLLLFPDWLEFRLAELKKKRPLTS